MTGALPYGGHHLGPTGRVFGEEPARGGGEGGRAGIPSVGGRHAGVLGLDHQEGAAGAADPVQRVGDQGGGATRAGVTAVVPECQASVPAMQVCSASTTRREPREPRPPCSASATWAVRRSWSRGPAA